MDIFNAKLSEIYSPKILLQSLNKGNVDDVNTYEPRGEYPLKSGNVYERRGGTAIVVV